MTQHDRRDGNTIEMKTGLMREDKDGRWQRERRDGEKIEEREEITQRIE